MRLHDSIFAPNPRRVRIFLAEKGVTVPVTLVDLAKMETKAPAFTALNPMQRTPVLELDDGTVLSESVAICRYFEELHPAPPLFGTGALGKAQVEMWNRRVELHFLTHVANAFRHGHPAMAAMEVPQIKELSESSKPKALEFLALLDTELAARPFIAGDTFSIADITGLVAFDFMKVGRIACPGSLTHVWRWREAVAARPSASA